MVARRNFLETTAGVALGAAALAQTQAQAAETPNEKIVVGVMGVNGRGRSLAAGFVGQPNCEVAYICDVDSRAIPRAVEVVKAKQKRAPQGVEDFRRILDDKSVDALIVAAPNHWHAPATILGCSAGKHVYVEKPCSHTAEEGELAVAAARKNNRVVTMGTQRRSYPMLIEAIAKIHNGVLGKTHYARSWYNNRRNTIGTGEATPPPSWLNYELWQGPAPDRPFKSNLVHYNWHWHWHWGNGELGNNGVHALDVARWGMNVDYPSQVSSGGGRFRFDDDQETADTHLVTFTFKDSTIMWEGLSWSPLGVHGTRFGVSFHGEKGSMVVTDQDYTIYDMKGKEVEKHTGARGDAPHFANFLDCIRSGEKPNADIEIAHKSTLLCHLGNIAHRTSSTLTCDPRNGRIAANKPAQALWGREYRKGYQPKV